MKKLEGKFDAKGVRLAVILPRFNESIGKKLFDGAARAFRDKNGKDSDLTLVRVPGAFEIPLAAQKLIDTGKFDAIIALGVLIKGQTYHFEYVARACTDGIREIMLKSGVPIIFEVLMVDDVELARKRALNDTSNKGYRAVLAAIEMVHLMRKM